MPTRPTGVTDNPNASGITDVDVVEHPALDIVTTLTADPTTGTSFAVASRSLFPQSGQFKVWVEGEVAYVTAGHGTGAGSWTVTRGQDGTSNVAHAIGTPVYMMVGAQRVEPVDA